LRAIEDKKNGHKGTIYEISWAPNGKQFMTASADKTCKVWDFETGTVLQTFCATGKPTVQDMQVSCIWLGDNLISVSLSGRINFWEMGKENAVRIVTGHKKTIQDMAVDKKNGFLYSVDVDSQVVRTECKSGECEDMIGDPHKGKQIKNIKLDCESNTFYTIGVSDMMFRHSTAKNELAEQKEGVQIDGASRGVATGNVTADLVVVGTHKKKVLIYNNMELQATIELGYAPTCVALSPDDKTLAVASEDRKFYFYNMDDQKESNCIASNFVRDTILRMAFSPDGKYIATADKNRHIWIWDYGNNNFEEPLNRVNSFQFHNSVISSIEWSADSTRLLSAGHDTNIYLWLNPTAGKSDNIHLDNAFQGGISRAQFLDDSRIVAVGKDATIRFFNIKS